jgi:predicted NUDIX family phosphoesterase
MSQLVKTKRQANFKDFKRFGIFKGLVEQNNFVFNSFVCELGFFGTRRPTQAKQSPIYTQIR